MNLYKGSCQKFLQFEKRIAIVFGGGGVEAPKGDSFLCGPELSKTRENGSPGMVNSSTFVFRGGGGVRGRNDRYSFLEL